MTAFASLLSEVMRTASLPFPLKAYSMAWWTEGAILGFLLKNAKRSEGGGGICGKDGVVLQRDVWCSRLNNTSAQQFYLYYIKSDYMF